MKILLAKGSSVGTVSDFSIVSCECKRSIVNKSVKLNISFMMGLVLWLVCTSSTLGGSRECSRGKKLHLTDFKAVN